MALLLALFSFAAAAFLLIDWGYHRVRCTLRVQARVSEIQHQKPGRLRKESRTFYPVYTFSHDGRPFTVRAREPSRTNQWKVGDEAELYIDPENPDRFRVGNQTGDLVFASVALGLGILFLLAARW